MHHVATTATHAPALIPLPEAAVPSLCTAPPPPTPHARSPTHQPLPTPPPLLTCNGVAQQRRPHHRRCQHRCAAADGQPAAFDVPRTGAQHEGLPHIGGHLGSGAQQALHHLQQSAAAVSRWQQQEQEQQSERGQYVSSTSCAAAVCQQASRPLCHKLPRRHQGDKTGPAAAAAAAAACPLCKQCLFR